MRWFLILALVPLVALGGLDYTELYVSSVTNAQATQTASSTLPVSGALRAVHLEITPTAGTWTNTITFSTTADKGVSFANTAFLTLSDLEGSTTNFVYYPGTSSHEADGSAIAADEVPVLFVGDTLKMTVTNTSSASTNAVRARVVTEN